MATEFSEIINSFKIKIIDYEFLQLTQEEENILMNARLKGALAKFRADKRKITFDYDMQIFNRELTSLEIETISYWLVYEWITPKINNVELFEHRLNTREFQGYSEANHLKEMKAIKDSCEADAFYWANQINNSTDFMFGGA